MPSLKSYLPKPFKRWVRARVDSLRLMQGGFYDCKRFGRHSGMLSKYSEDVSRAALITKYYHMIEKGMALPEPRAGFGEQAIHDLCKLLDSAIEDGVCEVEVQLAIDAIAGYRSFNAAAGIEAKPWISEIIKTARAAGIEPRGYPTSERSAFLPSGQHLDFLKSRSSVREFSDAEVPLAVLELAASAAQSAPCVCNRQAARVHFLLDPKIKQQALSFQNGNRGFGHQAAVVAIVTVDLRQFVEPSERYQAWIDGGMFAMNLLLGFHAQGYGACALNWSALPQQDRGLRSLGIVPECESVIMMVAIGGLKDAFRVARSARPPLESIYSVH